MSGRPAGGVTHVTADRRACRTVIYVGFFLAHSVQIARIPMRRASEVARKRHLLEPGVATPGGGQRLPTSGRRRLHRRRTDRSTDRTVRWRVPRGGSDPRGALQSVGRGIYSSPTRRGCSSVVERHVANVNVEGSTPFTRSYTTRRPSPTVPGRFVPVAQLDRASASGAEGYRFETCREHFKRQGLTPVARFRYRPASEKRTQLSIGSSNNPLACSRYLEACRDSAPTPNSGTCNLAEAARLRPDYAAESTSKRVCNIRSGLTLRIEHLQEVGAAGDSCCGGAVGPVNTRGAAGFAG